MKSFLALLVALVFISAGWAEHVEQSAPFVLDSDNWYSFLDTYDQVLVLFNTPGDKGCQECQIAPSELNKLLESKPNCVLASVDCSTQQTICQEHEVQNHLPAIKLFSSGIGVYDYPKRKVFVDALARFVETYTVPKFVVIDTIEELRDVIANNKVSAVGFFGNAVHDESIRGSFERTAAQLFLDMKFAVYELSKENANALDEYDLHPSDIAMFKTLGGHTSSITFDGPVSRRKLIRWIADNYPWLVTEITPERPFEKVAFGNVPILNMFLDYSDPESKEKYIGEMEALIEEYKGRMTLTYKSIEGEDLHQFERYGYSAKKFPIVMLFDLARSKTYTFPESRETNSETLKQFIDDFYDHKIQPHEVKEAIPEQPENAAVQIVVSDTFRKFIKNEDYDAVIFYYLPGKMCPHCIKFLEIFEELAETYSQNAGSEPAQIRFAKMNLDANERVPGRFIHNFPTIELFKRGEKNQEVLYSGPRTKEGLVHWLTAKSTTSVSASHFEKHGENSESEQKLDTKDLV